MKDDAKRHMVAAQKAYAASKTYVHAYVWYTAATYWKTLDPSNGVYEAGEAMRQMAAKKEYAPHHRDRVAARKVLHEMRTAFSEAVGYTNYVNWENALEHLVKARKALHLPKSDRVIDEETHALRQGMVALKKKVNADVTRSKKELKEKREAMVAAEKLLKLSEHKKVRLVDVRDEHIDKMKGLMQKIADAREEYKELSHDASVAAARAKMTAGKSTAERERDVLHAKTKESAAVKKQLALHKLVADHNALKQQVAADEKAVAAQVAALAEQQGNVVTAKAGVAAAEQQLEKAEDAKDKVDGHDGGLPAWAVVLIVLVVIVALGLCIWGCHQPKTKLYLRSLRDRINNDTDKPVRYTPVHVNANGREGSLILRVK